MKEMREIQEEVHRLAVSKGWWDGTDELSVDTLAAKLMLAVSELSECLEDIRNDGIGGMRIRWEGEKPCGGAIEMTDCVIRIMDTLAYYGYDLKDLVSIKHEYNQTRSNRHGGKRL